jgi:hypothetical protein
MNLVSLIGPAERPDAVPHAASPQDQPEGVAFDLALTLAISAQPQNPLRPPEPEPAAAAGAGGAASREGTLPLAGDETELPRPRPPIAIANPQTGAGGFAPAPALALPASAPPPPAADPAGPLKDGGAIELPPALLSAVTAAGIAPHVPPRAEPGPAMARAADLPVDTLAARVISLNAARLVPLPRAATAAGTRAAHEPPLSPAQAAVMAAEIAERTRAAGIAPALGATDPPGADQRSASATEPRSAPVLRAADVPAAEPRTAPMVRVTDPPALDPRSAPPRAAPAPPAAPAAPGAPVEFARGGERSGAGMRQGRNDGRSRPAPAAPAAPARPHDGAAGTGDAAAPAAATPPAAGAPVGGAASGLGATVREAATGPASAAHTPPGGTAPAPGTPKNAGDRVMLQFSGEGGLEGRVRVAVRGQSLHATIVSPDRETAQRLQSEIGDLQRALAERGFTDARVAIQETRSTGPTGTRHGGHDESRAREDRGGAPHGNEEKRDTPGERSRRRPQGRRPER